MPSKSPTTPVSVPIWQRLLWVGLGAGATAAAVVFAQVLTPEVPTSVDSDGGVYSEGGLFGNLFEMLAWFGVSWIVLMIAATGFASSRSSTTENYPSPSRVLLVWLGPVALVVLLVVVGIPGR